MNKEEIKKIVRRDYARIAKTQGSCCGGPLSKTCINEEISKSIGYNSQELRSVPQGSNMGLGCGNPIALASLKEGETVLDLGSGGGFDCFLAAKRVGETGKVIGIDMTPEMIDRARENVRRSKYRNVEFRLGEIENLPVANDSVDIIISNCVINLSTDKGRVFKEAFRVLKPGGRLMVSDIVLSKKLPKVVEENMKAYSSCISGAALKDKYLEMIRQAGFQDVKIVEQSHFPVEYIISDETAKEIVEKLNMTKERITEIADSIASVKVYGVKPK